MAETINVATVTRITQLQIKPVKNEFEINYFKDSVLINVDTNEILNIIQRKPVRALSSTLTPEQQTAILALFNTL